MKHAKLFFNPDAGNENLSVKDLYVWVTSGGYECRGASIKEAGWKNIEPDTDFMIISGGDGTVRKVVAELLYRQPEYRDLPLAVWPCGTANNISRALGLDGLDHRQLIGAWQKKNIRGFDLGFVKGLPESNFFLEGLGVGAFPKLIKKMLRQEAESSPDENLKAAQEVLYDIIHSIKPKKCRLEADGRDFSGEYVLAEIMNTGSIGPNLCIAPDADPSDGFFDVVLIKDNERDLFANYVHNKLRKTDPVYPFSVTKAKRIRLDCKKAPLHVDDERIRPGECPELFVELQQGILKFFVP